MADNAHEKREAIINAALKLFTERGFDGTPTALISKEAGVATGTLFRYFPTKEALINSAYSTAKGNLVRAMRDGLEDRKTMESKMRLIWGNTIRWGLRNPDELLFLEQFAASPYITRITEEEAMRQFEFFGELIEQGVSGGKLKDIHRGLMIEMMFSACIAVIKKILAHRLHDQTEMLIDSSFELVWGGLAR
jgi:AcrR family transcriptional regulator